MIESFGDRATEDVFHGTNSKQARRLPREIWGIVRRKLDLLNAAHGLEDLRVPPGNRLQALKGDLKGFYSIRVNDQYRIIFRFEGGHAHEVKCEDYH